jgi:hypothetical protein
MDAGSTVCVVFVVERKEALASLVVRWEEAKERSATLVFTRVVRDTAVCISRKCRRFMIAGENI